MCKAKKLAVVLATSSSVTATSMLNTLWPLERVPYIHHLLHFQKNLREIRVLIDLSSEVNAMTPAYAAKLGLRVRETNIGAQKIDGSTFDTFGMVLANFQMEDKFGRTRFFQETFLVANTTLEVILKMLFLTFSNVDIQFAQEEFTWRPYILAKALPTTKRVKLINKKEFAKVALDENSEIFVVNVASLNLAPAPGIYPDRATQIASLFTK